MNCKAEKCPYFGTNDFLASQRRCSLDGMSFSDPKKKECPLPSTIDHYREVLERLQKE